MEEGGGGVWRCVSDSGRPKLHRSLWACVRGSVLCALVSLYRPVSVCLCASQLSASHAGEDDGVLDPEHLRDAEGGGGDWIGTDPEKVT